MDRKQKILEFISSENYLPMKFKQIREVLGVPSNEREYLKEILDELEAEYKIIKDDKNRYTLPKKDLIQGIYERKTENFGFVKPLDSNIENIYISKELSKFAMNEDVVLVKILKEKEKNKKAEGEIVKIIKNANKEIIGTFQKSRNFGFVIPLNKNKINDIFISKKKFLNAKNNDLVIVKIIEYPVKNRKAEGEIIEILSGINKLKLDMISIIKEYNLPNEFSKEVLEEVKKININKDKNDKENRVDMRNEVIFTIDGDDAKDLDDAVSVKKLENGNYILNVSIADVSYFVRENTYLNDEAIKRGTSVYMLNSVIPMLPKELSNGICSLNAKEDRLAITVLMEINVKGDVISSEIYKSIINVNERMTYTNVQKILDGNDKEILKKYKKYIDDFKNMEKLALILKSRRDKAGTLNLDIPESKIIYDENGNIKDITKYEIKFSNEIIEQFMLTANETVAEKFFWLEAPFIYRVHETPEFEKINELNKLLFNLNLKIKGSKDNIHTKAFADVLEKVKGTPEEKIVSNFILHTLKLARYEDENKGHFRSCK